MTDGMPMPGGWTMTMMWMRMPGQTWPGAAASFTSMWLAMMIPMMLPSLVPMLSRYRLAISSTDKTHLNLLTAVVSSAYFFIWTIVGVLVFPIGATLAAIEMQQPALSRAVPTAIGVIVLAAGALQFTEWKARQLGRCREAASGRTFRADAGTAWRHGLCLGLHCVFSCAGMMAMLFAVGVMDLRVMAFVMAAITLERLAPEGERAARAIGMVMASGGLILIASALG